MNNSIRIAVAVLLLTSFMSARDRSNARSMVITRYGIVATSHVQASEAGAEILRRGGSAVDAAIAANAVLGVTEPMMNGMGGDLFAIYWDAKTGKLYGLNSSGWAPKALTIAHLKATDNTAMPVQGIDSVTVPGAVAGWQALHERFGKTPWKDLFQPAIFYADEGYPVPEVIASYWKDAADWLANDKEAQKLYLPGGKSPEVGQIFQNHDLAKALRLVAQQGADAFYKGEIARAILNTSQALGEHDGGQRSRRIFSRVGRADFDHISRLDDLRTASERTGHGRARNAQHHGDVDAISGWSAQRGGAP